MILCILKCSMENAKENVSTRATAITIKYIDLEYFSENEENTMCFDDIIRRKGEVVNKK